VPAAHAAPPAPAPVAAPITAPPAAPPTTSPATPAPAEDAALAALERARGEMRALLARNVSEVLRGDFTEGARAQLDAMSAPALREKALKLMEDAHDRARWEGVRLAEVLERSDRAWAAKFEEFSGATRARFEAQARDAVGAAKKELLEVRAARRTRAPRLRRAPPLTPQPPPPTPPPPRRKRKRS
jgi:hypothetical protein